MLCEVTGEFSVHRRNVALNPPCATPLQGGKFYGNFRWRALEFVFILFIEWWAKPRCVVGKY